MVTYNYLSYQNSWTAYWITSAIHIECSHGVQIPESNCPQYSVHIDTMFQKEGGLSRMNSDPDAYRNGLEKWPNSDPMRTEKVKNFTKHQSYLGTENLGQYWTPIQSEYRIVFGSLVRSGFLMPQGLNHNRNRSSQFEKCQKTRLNRNRPVFCGLLQLQNRF